MRGEIHGHVHNKRDEMVKTAAVMRQKVRCACDRKPSQKVKLVELRLSGPPRSGVDRKSTEKVKLTLSPCAVDGRSNASDATSFAIASRFGEADESG